MDLNKLLAFNQLFLDKSEAEKARLATQLDIDYEEYSKRIKGKEKEAEFLVILKSMGCLKHLEAFDEGVSHITNEYTPDYMVEMTDGYKMMIEVKHTDKDTYRISMGNLNKRIEFAQRHNLPLRFAVSLNGFWGLFTTETLLEKKGKLTIKDFGGEQSTSWLDQELETCSYMFPSNMKIRSVYSKDNKKGTWISNGSFGQLVSYELYCNDKKIFRMKGKESQFLIYTVYLEALQNRLANSNQRIEQSANVTIVTESFDGVINTIPEYEFLTAPIKHIVSGSEDDITKYNAMIAVSKKDFKYFDKGILRVILAFLVENGVDIIVFRDSKGYKFEDYAKIFWNKEKL